MAERDEPHSDESPSSFPAGMRINSERFSRSLSMFAPRASAILQTNSKFGTRCLCSIRLIVAGQTSHCSANSDCDMPFAPRKSRMLLDKFTINSSALVALVVIVWDSQGFLKRKSTVVSNAFAIRKTTPMPGTALPLIISLIVMALSPVSRERRNPDHSRFLRSLWTDGQHRFGLFVSHATISVLAFTLSQSARIVTPNFQVFQISSRTEEAPVIWKVSRHVRESRSLSIDLNQVGEVLSKFVCVGSQGVRDTTDQFKARAVVSLLNSVDCLQAHVAFFG